MGAFEYRITYNNGRKAKWVPWPDLKGALSEIKWRIGDKDNIIKNIVVRRRKK